MCFPRPWDELLAGQRGPGPGCPALAALLKACFLRVFKAWISPFAFAEKMQRKKRLVKLHFVTAVHCMYNSIGREILTTDNSVIQSIDRSINHLAPSLLALFLHWSHLADSEHRPSCAALPGQRAPEGQKGTQWELVPLWQTQSFCQGANPSTLGGHSRARAAPQPARNAFIPEGRQLRVTEDLQRSVNKYLV